MDLVPHHATLRHLTRIDPDPRVRHRADRLVMVAGGMSLTEAAQAFGCARTSLCTWATCFLAERRDGLAIGTLSIGDIFDKVVSLLVNAATRTCQVLNLELGPLDLDLLGLVVHLDQVMVNIAAESGSWKLLGDLRCAGAHLLDGSGPLGAIAGLLNRILGILG